MLAECLRVEITVWSRSSDCVCQEILRNCLPLLYYIKRYICIYVMCVKVLAMIKCCLGHQHVWKSSRTSCSPPPTPQSFWSQIFNFWICVLQFWRPASQQIRLIILMVVQVYSFTFLKKLDKDHWKKQRDFAFSLFWCFLWTVSFVIFIVDCFTVII